MFSAVLNIKSMGSFVHTARIFFITHFMIFTAYARVKDSLRGWEMILDGVNTQNLIIQNIK